MVKQIIDTRPVGSKVVILPVELSVEDWLSIQQETGRIFQLGQCSWDESGKEAITLVPGKGYAEIQESQDEGGT